MIKNRMPSLKMYRYFTHLVPRALAVLRHIANPVNLDVNLMIFLGWHSMNSFGPYSPRKHLISCFTNPSCKGFWVAGIPMNHHNLSPVTYESEPVTSKKICWTNHFFAMSFFECNVLKSWSKTFFLKLLQGPYNGLNGGNRDPYRSYFTPFIAGSWALTTFHEILVG